MTNIEIASQRALDIINNLGGAASQFRHNWLVMQAYSTMFEGPGDQRATLIAAITESISNEFASAMLDKIDSEINYLQQNPVGDLRFEDTDPRFTRNGRRDIEFAIDKKIEPSTRLAHLVCVVYQVRCNLEHGHKTLTTPRSQHLFKIGNDIISMVIQALVSSGAES